MKPRKLTPRELSSLISISVTDKGFTVWVRDTKNGTDHWIVDGSCIKADGEIRLSLSRSIWQVSTVLKDDCITIIKIPRVKKKVVKRKRK
jgi:hypothetical protein